MAGPVKRYKLISETPEHAAMMCVRPDGKFVSYADYAELAKVAELMKQLLISAGNYERNDSFYTDRAEGFWVEQIAPLVKAMDRLPGGAS